MRKMFTLAAMLFMLAGITVFYGCGAKVEEKQNKETPVDSEENALGNTEEETPAESQSSPLLGDFETVNLEGEAVTQDIFGESKLTMLNVWGTFCGPCIREMPDLGELAEEYKDRMQMVGFISDVTDPDDAAAIEIVEETGADYTHIVNSAEMMKGYMGDVQAVPTTIFLDGMGSQVGETYVGAKTKEQWKTIIDQMLEKAGA